MAAEKKFKNKNFFLRFLNNWTQIVVEIEMWAHLPRHDEKLCPQVYYIAMCKVVKCTWLSFSSYRSGAHNDKWATCHLEARRPGEMLKGLLLVVAWLQCPFDVLVAQRIGKSCGGRGLSTESQVQQKHRGIWWIRAGCDRFSLTSSRYFHAC